MELRNTLAQERTRVLRIRSTVQLAARRTEVGKKDQNRTVCRVQTDAAAVEGAG